MVASGFILPNTRWKIRLDRSAFDKLKSEESFWCVVALSRVVNALRFVHSPLEHYQNDSPGALRVRYNSFLFNYALFYEASLFVQRLHKHHGQLPEFQALASVLNTKEARELLQSNLSGIRNKLVFHVDIEEIGEQLTKLELDEPIFVSAMGITNEQTYYELADLCAISTFSGSAFPNTDTGLQVVEQLIKKTTELTLEFLTKAELFIVAVLVNGGWEMVTTPESQVPSLDDQLFLDYFTALGNAPFVNLDFVTKVRTSATQLLKAARKSNKEATEETCMAFANDLLSNPSPTPSITRGLLVADLMRSMGYQPMKYGRGRPSKLRLVKNLVIAFRAAKKAAEYPVGSFWRYEFKKFVKGYVALIEGDYKSVLAVLSTLAALAESDNRSFAEAKRILSSMDWNSRSALLESINQTGCAIALGPYDRQLRNAFSHETYSQDGDTLRYRDGSAEREIPLIAFISKFAHLKAVVETVSPTLVDDPTMVDELSRHWDPEFR